MTTARPSLCASNSKKCSPALDVPWSSLSSGAILSVSTADMCMSSAQPNTSFKRTVRGGDGNVSLLKKSNRARKTVDGKS